MPAAPRDIQRIASVIQFSFSIYDQACILPRMPHPALWKFRTSALRRYRRLQRSVGVTGVSCRYFGARFTVDVRDVIGFDIATGRFEFGDLKRLLAGCERVQPSVFVDVGANLGAYSCIAGVHQVAPRIVAFEPDPDNFANLRRNVALNGLATVETRNEAVGAQRGMARLSIGSADNRGLSAIHPEGDCRVSMTTLDAAFPLVGSTIAIKIDVEGYEPEVLRGATNLLARNRGYALIEARDDAAARHTEGAMNGHGWRLLERYGLNLMFTKLGLDHPENEGQDHRGR